MMPRLDGIGDEIPDEEIEIAFLAAAEASLEAMRTISRVFDRAPVSGRMRVVARILTAALMREDFIRAGERAAAELPGQEPSSIRALVTRMEIKYNEAVRLAHPRHRTASEAVLHVYGGPEWGSAWPRE